MDVNTLLEVIRGAKTVDGAEARALEVLCIQKLTEQVAAAHDMSFAPTSELSAEDMSLIRRLNDIGLLKARHG